MVHNALSVDVEDYFQVSNFDDVIGRDRWDAQPRRVEETTRRLLDLFEAHGARATFFVLGWVAERHGALVRTIAARGHEVACHGFGHELVYAIGPERFREDLRRARRVIEDACGAAVEGYRAPSFSITARSLWALPILVEEGFRFDSSIFPVRHPRYGLPGFPRHPLRLDLGGGLRIDEFPPTTVQAGSLTLPIAGGAYLRFLPGPLFRRLFRGAARRGPALLYLHPWELDADQPRQRVGLRTRLNHYHGLGRTERRLQRLLEEHTFAPLGEVLAGLQASGGLPERRLTEVAGAAASPTAPHPALTQEVRPANVRRA